MRQVFISYVYEDKKARETIERWAAEGHLGDVHITGEQQDMREKGEAAIRNHIAPYLKGASALVLLVGANSHNHDWVRYEADYMQSAGKPVIVVRLPGTQGAAPPSVRHLREVDFEPEALRRALGT
jgi:hypothetical protein